MKQTSTQRNKPIATVIKNYMNKKSGKVTESRNEIQRRFPGLDWKDQKKIMSAFLDSCMSDRDWAYSRLLNLWDTSFEARISELWETYHERKCGWVIVRHFPLTYIKEHKDEFSEERDYFFICLRLAMEKDYEIDRSKLSNTDYLAVLYHTGREIQETDACDTLFGIVHDCCIEDVFMRRLEHTGDGRYPNVITPANYHEVNLGIYYLLKLERYDVVGEFRHWDADVAEMIYNSPEFRAIDRNELDSDYEYDRRRVEIANIYACQALDEKYKSSSDPTIERMRDDLQRSVEWHKMRREQAASASIRTFDDVNDDFFDGIEAPF